MSTDNDLAIQAGQFAQNIEDMLTTVLGGREDSYTATPRGISYRWGSRFVIQTANEQGVPLTVDGKTILRLSYEYACSASNSYGFLQIDESSMSLRVESDAEPFLHYDYVRKPHGDIPAAHINIHGSNDSVTRAMLACGSKSQGKNRRKSFLEKGKFPTFSSLHFPVGGDRLRPGIEDVLQLAIYEFAIDVQDNWRQGIENNRAQYRENQIKALIREFPDLAYDVLVHELNCDLSCKPTRPERNDRPSELIRY